jgi:type II secretory ATPase GspE/PulE/Tfp pilus assembly ATPase PilB-like protein
VQAARESLQTLRQAGLVKVMAGLTGLEELLGCTHE